MIRMMSTPHFRRVPTARDFPRAHSDAHVIASGDRLEMLVDHPDAYSPIWTPTCLFGCTSSIRTPTRPNGCLLSLSDAGHPSGRLHANLDTYMSIRVHTLHSVAHPPFGCPHAQIDVCSPFRPRSRFRGHPPAQPSSEHTPCLPLAVLKYSGKCHQEFDPCHT